MGFNSILNFFKLDDDEFDEYDFNENIKQIIVIDNGSLEFVFYDGRTLKWQGM